MLVRRITDLVGQGTGLGLLVVPDVVQAHSGCLNKVLLERLLEIHLANFEHAGGPGGANREAPGDDSD